MNNFSLSWLLRFSDKPRMIANVAVAVSAAIVREKVPLVIVIVFGGQNHSNAIGSEKSPLADELKELRFELFLLLGILRIKIGEVRVERGHGVNGEV